MSAPKPRCPICGAATVPSGDGSAPHRPFCSLRCKLVDLDRWLSGDYRIPGPDLDPTLDPEDPRLPPPGGRGSAG